jgi:thioredoxin 1
VIAHVTDATFKTDVLESELPTLVDFTADWCPPCRAIAPVLDALAAETRDNLKIVKVDVDTNAETAAAHGVQGLPTLIVFRQGVEITRIVGAQPLGRLRALVSSALEAAPTLAA